MIKLEFHLNNGSVLTTDKTELVGVYNNPDLTKLIVITNKARLQIPIEHGERLVFSKKEDYYLVGKQKTVRWTNKKLLFKIMNKDIILESWY